MTPSQRDTNLNYQCVSSVEVRSYKGGLEDGGHLLSHNPSMNNPRDEITSAAEWLLSSSWSRSCKMNLTVMMWCSQSFIELHTMTQLLWSLLFMSGQRAVYIPETLPENRTWASLTAQQSVQTSSQLAGEDVCSVPQRGLQAGAEARMDADRYQKAFLSMKSCLNIYTHNGCRYHSYIQTPSRGAITHRSHTHSLFTFSVFFIWSLERFQFYQGHLLYLLMRDLGLRKQQSSSVKHIFPQVFPEVWIWSKFGIRLLFIRRAFTVFSKSQAAGQDNHLFRWC